MILIAAAVVVDRLDAPTRVLAARRLGPAALAGRWEFAGGKVEPGEAPEEAARREVREELSVTVRLGAEVGNPHGEAWPISAAHEMRLWWAEVVSGELRPTGSHDEVRWLAPAELLAVPWLPADVAIAEHLRSMLTDTP